MHLYITICYKGDVTDQPLVCVQRRQFRWVIIAEGQNLPVKTVHFGDIGRTQIDVMQFDFHNFSVAQSCAASKG